MSNHILIIEDDAAIAEVLRLNLECADYHVTAFDNGLAAWNALEASHDYDLALLDMMLPGVDGFTLLPKLQEYGIPVICLTAMNDTQHEVQGLRGGAEDYIAKPFDLMCIALVNLVENSAKASAPGQTIRIQASETGFTVTDHGRGIPEKDLQRVTDPFYMGDPSRSKANGGFGLGLALVREIAAVHGGTLTLESTLGEGTTARIVIGNQTVTCR